MNGDHVTVMRDYLAQTGTNDLDTLAAIQELIEQRGAELQFERLVAWSQAGWSLNPPGLRCGLCDAPTWGRQRGRREQIRCVNPACGATREVFVQ